MFRLYIQYFGYYFLYSYSYSVYLDILVGELKFLYGDLGFLEIKINIVSFFKDQICFEVIFIMFYQLK